MAYDSTEKPPVALFCWLQRLYITHAAAGLRAVPVFAMVLYFAFAALPPGPAPSNTGLDPSWEVGLNVAHAQGLAAGRDWIFSFGPLGFLTCPETESGDFWLGLMYRLTISLVWCLALFVLAMRAPSLSMGLWLVAVFGIVALFDDFMYVDRLELAIAALALLPVWKLTRWRYLDLSLLALLAGFALMVKFNIGVEAISLFLIMWGYTVWKDRAMGPCIYRSALIPVMVLIVSVVAFYIGSSGQVRYLGSYLFYTWEVARSYSESMGTAGPMWQLSLAAIAVSAPFLLLLVFADSPRRFLPAVFPAGIIAYFFFKHAFVRQNDPRFISFLAQLAVAMLFVLAFSQTRRNRRLIVLLQISFILTSVQVGRQLYPNKLAELARRLDLRAATGWAPVYTDWKSAAAGLEIAGRANLAKDRLDDRFQRLIGRSTVEAVPWEIAMVQANGWAWRPRPVFQSYQACRPSLDRLNADFLAGPRAADYIVLGWGDIDERHPFLDDALSWRAMLNWYDVVLVTPDNLLLRRRPTPRFGKPLELGYTVAHWNEELSIPQDQPLLLMSVEIHKVAYGSLWGLLFRNSVVFAEVTCRSAPRKRWRAVAPNIAAGFPVSSFPQNLDGVAALFQSQRPADRPTTILFETDRPEQYTDTLKVRWTRLPSAQ